MVPGEKKGCQKNSKNTGGGEKGGKKTGKKLGGRYLRERGSATKNHGPNQVNTCKGPQGRRLRTKRGTTLSKESVLPAKGAEN